LPNTPYKYILYTPYIKSCKEFYWIIKEVKLKYGYMVKNKVIQCLHCGKSSSEMVEEEEFKHAEKIKKILKSNKTAYEKKIALFN
jgi:predicted transcriptional regulator